MTMFLGKTGSSSWSDALTSGSQQARGGPSGLTIKFPSKSFMHTTKEEMRAGFLWFIGAGIFSVLLSVALYMADEGLSNSTRERDLANALFDMRTAQTSLPTGSMDERLNAASPR